MNIISKLFQKKSPQHINFEIQSTFSNFSGSAEYNAAFRSAVDCISRHSAKLKPNNPLLNNPNPYMTVYDLLYKFTSSYYTRNNAFILIQRGNNKIESLYNLNPASVEFIGAADGDLYIKMTFTDGKQVTFDYSDIIHLRRHFLNNELLGSDNSPLHPLIDTAETLTQATSKAAKNAVNIRGVLKFTSLVNPAQVKLEKEQFVNDYFNLSNTGGVAATDQRYDFVPTNTTPYSVPVEQINAINNQIYSYLGISPKIVSGEYSEDEFAAFYESVVEPFALQMSLEFTRKCGVDVTFTAERLEFSSAKTRISLLRELLLYGIISVNEARTLLALPEVEDGDKRLQSLNFVDSTLVNKYQLQEENE